jgi:hypothetical protein
MKLQASVDTRRLAVLRYPLAATPKLQSLRPVVQSSLADPKSTTDLQLFGFLLLNHIFSVNLLNRVRTACHRWLASASKPFRTASEKHPIAVATMSQVRECCRALSLVHLRNRDARAGWSYLFMSCPPRWPRNHWQSCYIHWLLRLSCSLLTLFTQSRFACPGSTTDLLPFYYLLLNRKTS